VLSRARAGEVSRRRERSIQFQENPAAECAQHTGEQEKISRKIRDSQPTNNQTEFSNYEYEPP
jgi:hypothetical protein